MGLLGVEAEQQRNFHRFLVHSHLPEPCEIAADLQEMRWLLLLLMPLWLFRFDASADTPALESVLTREEVPAEESLTATEEPEPSPAAGRAYAREGAPLLHGKLELSLGDAIEMI